MPRTRRSKKYKRKTIKRKGGNPFLKNAVKLGKQLVPAARNFATQLGQTTFNIATGKSNLESPPTSAPLKTHYKAPPLSYISPLGKPNDPITPNNKAIHENVYEEPDYLASITSILSDTKNVSVKPGYLASTGIKVKALTRGLTVFSYPSLARILITNISAKSNAEYLTTQYIRNIISLFAPILEAALDDIIIADVSVSEKVVKSIITDETLSPGDIKTTLVRVLAKHLQKMAPKLKEELGKTKFVGVSPEFMTIIKPHLDALFDDLKEELSAIIIRKLTNAVDKLTVDNITTEWQSKKKEFVKKFKPEFDKFMKGPYSEKIKMLYSYSLLSYNNTMATFNEHKEPQKQAGSKPKIRITDFAKDWYSSTQELLNIWYEEKLQNQNVLTINVLISAIDLSIPTLIDEYCNYWDPNALCNKQQIQQEIQEKFGKIMEEFRKFGANYVEINWEEFREFDATYEKINWDEFDNLKIIDENV